MKRWMCGGILVWAWTQVLWAYNPPVSGERMDQLIGATALTRAGSSAGGALFLAEPHSVLFNPALTADEQRIAVQASGTFISAPRDVHRSGGAFQAGVVAPWKWFIGTAVVRGNFAPFERFATGNTLGVTFGAAKNVTEHFSVGMTFSGGAFWGAGNDWLLEAGFGALFRFPRLGFLSDVRVGVSVLHLGKTYTATTLPGAYTPSRTADMFPGIGMLKLGAGALFVDTKRFDLGMTLDLSFPSFQNCIVDVGLEFSIIDAVYVSVAESFNIRELVSHYRDVMPSVSIGYRFIFKTGGAQVLAARGWQESEMRVELGWKNLYEQTNAFSGDVLLKFGTQDTEPPVIELWGGE